MKTVNYFNPKSLNTIINKAAEQAFIMTEGRKYNIGEICSTRRKYIVQYLSTREDCEVLLLIRDYYSTDIVAIATVIDTRGC